MKLLQCPTGGGREAVGPGGDECNDRVVSEARFAGIA